MSFTSSGFDKRVRNLLVADGAAPAPPPPPAPPTGMLQWMDNNSLSSLNDGDPISTWVDTSGNGLDCTQAGAARPTYEAAGFLGQGCARFSDASSQWFNMPAGFADFTAGLTLVLVVEQRAGGLFAQANYGISNAAVNSAWSFAADTGVNRYGIVAFDPGLLTLLSALGTVSYAPALLVFEISAAGVGRIELNHVDIATGALTVPSNVARTANFLGSDALGFINVFSGRIAESLLYASTLTAPQRVELDAYIADKYGL